MGTFLHRTTLQLSLSVAPDSLAEALANYVSDPDMLPVAGEPVKYWILTGDDLSVMNQTEKDAVDLQILTDKRDALVAQLDQVEDIMRQVIKAFVSEINLLRVENGWSERTIAQLKTVIRNGLGS